MNASNEVKTRRENPMRKKKLRGETERCLTRGAPTAVVSGNELLGVAARLGFAGPELRDGDGRLLP